MKNVILRVVFILIVLSLATGIITNKAEAVWQVLLDEHFEEDQRNPNLQWPWFTDLRALRRWHWNPRPPYFRAEANATDYCWGLQDYIYNRYVTVEDDHAMWCAYTNQTNVNQPRWPENDDYMNNQNAWMWWGPVDLSNAVNARVSFWTYVHMSHYSNDSLTVGIVNSPPQNYPFPISENFVNFRQNTGVSRTFSAGIGDWQQYIFDLDSVRLDGDSASFIGDGMNAVYIVFVWQSDNFAVTGRGAFIDDVVMLWDDGLFDLSPQHQFFGYEISADSTFWTVEHPRVWDQIKLRCDWAVIGEGQTPEFTIRCLIDDEVFYTESRSVRGGADSIFTSVTDEPWLVTAGVHVIRWELDTPLETNGVVEETHEENNSSEVEMEIIWNPAPLFTLTAPTENITVPINNEVDISWTLSDSNEADQSFTVYIFGTDDTSGFAADHEVIYQWGFVYSNQDLPRGETTISWDMLQAQRDGWLTIDGEYYIVGLALDNDPSNIVYSFAPGKVKVDEFTSVQQINSVPDEFYLADAFPNPFNGSVNLKYGIPHTGEVSIGIYDMSGRFIEFLERGIVSQGNHAITWTPNKLPAGVFIVRMEAENFISHKKLIYLP